LCEESKESVPLQGGIKGLVEKYMEDIPPQTREKINLPANVFRAKDSPTCPGGTRGRVAVFEVLEMDSDFEQVLLKSPTEEEINKLARTKGFLTMKEDALLKALGGQIGFEEVAKL
jgi:type II secretory ATPase GspE/PulE/Tfp pilus assembly ATPase PilB-like protein